MLDGPGDLPRNHPDAVVTGLATAWTRDTGGALTATIAVPAGPGSATINPERVFSRTSFWSDNPLPPDAPLHPSSSVWAANLRAQLGLSDTPYNGRLAPKAGALPGSAWFSLDAGGVPIYVAPADQPRVPVAVASVLANVGWTPAGKLLHEVLMTEGVPIPAGARVDPSSDRSLIVYQSSKDSMWEFWVAAPAAGKDAEGREYAWTCKWGGRMLDCSTRAGTYRTSSSPPEDASWGHAATGLPMLGGVITPEEWASDDPRAIRHPLRLLVGEAGRKFLPPAHRGDGIKDDTWIPEGARVRLAPDVDLGYLSGNDEISRQTLKLSLALRDYAAFVTDVTHGGVALQFRSPQSYYWQGLPKPYDLGDHQPYPNDFMWRIPWQSAQVLDPSVSPE